MKTKRQTKAKTAYELLARVAVAIESQPEAYFQADWTCPVDFTDMNPRIAAKNECGTAFCRAGWAVGLHDGFDVAKELDGACAHRCDELLGLGSGATDSLYYDGIPNKKVGTKAYARAGASGVRKFMKKHAAHLKARKLRGV